MFLKWQESVIAYILRYESVIVKLRIGHCPKEPALNILKPIEFIFCTLPDELWIINLDPLDLISYW